MIQIQDLKRIRNKNLNHNKKQILIIQAKKEDKEALNHKVEVINLFDKVKIAPPMFSTNLKSTLDLLLEKKEYFEN